MKTHIVTKPFNGHAVGDEVDAREWLNTDKLERCRYLVSKESIKEKVAKLKGE